MKTSISLMGLNDKLFYNFLFLTGLTLVSVFGFWWFFLDHVPHNFSGIFHIFDYIIFGLLSYVVWYQVIMEYHSWDVARSMRHPIFRKAKPGLKVAFLTAFVPGKEPYSVLETTLEAMVNNEYPHDTWLLDEGNDPKTKAICKKLGAKHFSRLNYPHYRTSEGKFKIKTKGGNYNSWFDMYGNKYDIVAQLDVDFVPKKEYLTRTLGYFNDPTVAFVGTPQIYGNTKDSWIAKGAAEQAYGFYGFGQRGYYGKNMQLFIGSNHVVRVSAHNHIDGYAGHIVEDHLTGMKFYSNKWKSVYVPEVLAIGEGPSTWEAYFSQQMRWAYGLFDIFFKHTPRIFTKLNFFQAINYFTLQNFYFYGLAQVIGVLLLVLYFIFGINATDMKIGELAIFYLPVIYIQLVIFVWLQRFYINPQNESGFHIRGKLLSLAAWPIYFIALFSLFTRKNLVYKITPKGAQNLDKSYLSLFYPHVILGSLTALGLIISFFTNFQAIHLVILAALNTLVMYGFAVVEISKKISWYLQKRKLTQFLKTIDKARQLPRLQIH